MVELVVRGRGRQDAGRGDSRLQACLEGRFGRQRRHRAAHAPQRVSSSSTKLPARMAALLPLLSVGPLAPSSSRSPIATDYRSREPATDLSSCKSSHLGGLTSAPGGPGRAVRGAGLRLPAGPEVRHRAPPRAARSRQAGEIYGNTTRARILPTGRYPKIGVLQKLRNFEENECCIMIVDPTIRARRAGGAGTARREKRGR